MNRPEPKQWRRVNNDKIKEQKYRLHLKHLFDGDHAGLNDFNLRSIYTIQTVIKMSKEMDDLMEKKVAKEQGIDEFKEKALTEGAIINLKDATQDCFMDSDSMEEFWRVCFEIQRKQQVGVTI